MSCRLVIIRREFFGERGRSQFARELGIPLTSYIHYETDRTPPADVLVAAAQLTGTSLEWLLCGTGPQRHSSDEPVAQLLNRLGEILHSAPELFSAVEDYVRLLDQKLPRSPVLPFHTSSASVSSLIPVIGSTAAGLARFWEEVEADVGGQDADARLEQLLARQGQQTAGQGETMALPAGTSETVALVQYSQPDEQGILEFLDAVGLKARHPDAVAWRIDGDSMSPRYCDGDFVITSPQFPAVDMQPCVARQRGQIGVNCKLFHIRGETVLLIPINETSKIQHLAREQLLWAWRVLASVRLQ